MKFEFFNYFFSFPADTAYLNEKSTKTSDKISGIPYKNLKIGVAKEKWTNEKRFLCCFIELRNSSV